MICEPIWSEPDKIIFLNVKYIFENSWNGEFVKWWIRERWIREMINSWNCTFFVNSSTNFEYICLLVLRIINRKLENSWNNMTWTGFICLFFRCCDRSYSNSGGFWFRNWYWKNSGSIPKKIEFGSKIICDSPFQVRP